MTLTITLDENESKLMSMIAVDPVVWLQNAASARIDALIEQLRSSPQWSEAIAITIRAGGNAGDERQIALNALDAGLYQTMEAQHLEAKAAIDALSERE